MMVGTVRRTHRLGGLAFICGVVLLTLTWTAPAANAEAEMTVAISGNVHPFVEHGMHTSTLAGNALPDAPVDIVVSLIPRNRARLEAIAFGASNTKSPFYGHMVSDAEYKRDFAPLPDDVRAVVAYLRGAGMNNVSPDSSGLAVSATTTLQQASRAFQTRFGAFVREDGQLAYGNLDAPRLPANLARVVTAIAGLDNLTPAQPRSFMISTETKPNDLGLGGNGLKAAQIQHYYGLASNDSSPGFIYGLHNNDITGAGQTIGIITRADFTLADIAKWITSASASGKADDPDNAFRFSHPVINRIPIPNSGKVVTSLSGRGETALDIEAVITAAPGATINVYVTGNSDAGIQKAYLAALKDHVLVTTDSWGVCEHKQSQAQTDALHNIFMAGVVQGTTVLAASGDNGYAECKGEPPKSSAQPDLLCHNSCPYISVGEPGNDPLVLAVGGTYLNIDANGNIIDEEGWSCKQPASPMNCQESNGGGSGGGFSTLFALPDYQKGLAFSDGDTTHRHLPDISMDADPRSGLVIGLTNPQTHKFFTATIGGTSLASPLLAGTLALNGQLRAGRMGLLQNLLYQPSVTDNRDGSVYYQHSIDITIGNNGYAAAKGWDAVTGVGGIGAYDNPYYSGSAVNFVFSLPVIPDATPDKLVVLVPKYYRSADGKGVSVTGTTGYSILYWEAFSLVTTRSGGPFVCSTTIDAEIWLDDFCLGQIGSVENPQPSYFSVLITVNSTRIIQDAPLYQTNLPVTTDTGLSYTFPVTVTITG